MSQFITLFFFFALILAMVYWVNQAVRLFEQLIANGQDLSIFLKLTALSLPNVVRAVVPIAAFSAVVYVIHRLLSESELAIAQSTGASPYRLARPVVVMGVLVSVGLGLLTHLVVPLSLGQLAQERALIEQDGASRLLREGIFHHPIEGVTFYVRDIGAQGELIDLFIADLRDDEQHFTYSANQAFLAASDTGPKLAMLNGLLQIYETATELLSTTSFDDLVVDLQQFKSARDIIRPRASNMTSWQLGNPEIRNESNIDLRSAMDEIHQRTSRALVVFAYVALAYSVMVSSGTSRMGPWLQTLVAVSLMVVLQILTRICEAGALADPGLWWLWYVPFVGGVAGALAILSGQEHWGRIVAARAIRTGA